MCDLCLVNNEARRDAMEHRALQLSSLACMLRDLGYGRIELHSTQAQQIGLKAQQVIKFLAEDWL